MNIEDNFNIIESMFRDNPNFLVRHHIDSYNLFFKEKLKEIIIDNNPIRFITEFDEESKLYKYTAEIYIGGKNGDKIYYGKPIIYDNVNNEERIHYMMPNEARLRNMTYGFPIHYDVDIDFKILQENEDETKTGANRFNVLERTDTIRNVFLGKFPIMLKSYICLLNKLDKNVCYNLGECKNDPGGYFIIDGKEKVIVSQESRADNILYVKDKFNDIYSHVAEIRSVSEDASKPIRTLSVRIMADQPAKSYGNIVVNVPNVRKPVPLFILMRALGVISDKKIIETCLLDLKKHEELLELFIPSVYDAGNIFTQTSALNYIATLTKAKTTSSVMDILMDYFLPHIGELNFKHKALYLGYIVKKLLLVYIKAELPTNRDKYNSKRIQNTGILIHELFSEYYKLQKSKIFLKIDSEYHFKGSNTTNYQDVNFPNLILNNKELIFNERVVEDGFKRAFKGNWGSAAHTKRPGVVQQLNRLSFFSFMCQLRKTNLNIGDATKMIEPRLLNGTQYGYLCPLHSPDGGNIGLHKHLATSVKITTGVSIKPFIPYLKKLGLILLEECSTIILSKKTKVFINGRWIGCTLNPMDMVNIVKLHRRNNLIYNETSILFDIKHNEIQIWVDAGRLCRPLFYIENKQPSYLKNDMLNKIKSNDFTWQELLKGTLSNKNTNKNANLDVESLKKTSGIFDLIDASEGESTKILLKNTSVEDITNETHMEIHESLILGLMANQIIFPENNPYPRNAFSCGQAKQGVSLYNSNFQNRIDKSAFVLNYGQLPLTKSRYFKHFTNNEHVYGENAIVAVMCYSGYNVEDAVIINGGSLKRGLFRTTYYNMYEDHEENSKIGNINVDSQFMNIENNNVLGIKEGYDYSKLDSETGLIKENTIVDQKTIVIGKATTNILEENYFNDASIKTKKGQTGIVDKSFITEGETGNRIAKVRIRAERIPRIGDKFCSRAGQKGTIGLILPEEDMPTTADGLKPDIIVNPHAMPSRMTIGHLVEALSSKMAALLGGFSDCTAFVNDGPRHEIFGGILRENGYHSSGNEVLYNGMTGEQLESEIYIGPTFYLRLKHMPKDKINYRARGPRTVLTRQTVGGRANDGGLRIGEMDRDCLIAHGMSSFVKESMIERGDKYYMAICNNTGTIAVYNENKNIFLSPMLDGPLKYEGDLANEKHIIQQSVHGRNFSIICVPYAFKLLMQELKTMNIQMRIITEDNVDKLTSLYMGHKTIKNIYNYENDARELELKEKEEDKFNNKNNLLSQNSPGAIARALIKTKYDEITRREKLGLDDDYFIEEKPLYYENDYIEQTTDNFYPTLMHATKIRELGLDKELAEYIISEDGDVNVGGIVKLRHDNNLVSTANYKIIGYDKYNRAFTLKALSERVTNKIVTRPLSEIFYKGVEDFPSRKINMGENISPDSFDLMLDNSDELKKLTVARENFMKAQDTPEYFRMMAEGSTPESPEVSPDRDVPEGYSPRVNYDERTPSWQKFDFDKAEAELEEEDMDDEDEEIEEGEIVEGKEKKSSVVLNENKPSLTILGNVEEKETDDNDELSD